MSGGLISGIGKGTTAAAIGLLLQSAGYKVIPLKFENYLNIDAGTINPIEHGDPFLCWDGCEGDMDLGSYEKTLNINLGKQNFITMGQIYQHIIEKERRFEFNGEDVDPIPYIPNEIIERIETAANASKADIVTIELGGTAGEYQNVFYYEASRMLAWRHPGDVIHVHVSYVPTPAHLGEPKTKPTQLSIKTLNSMGIQPDFVVARSERMLDQRRKDKLAMASNMLTDHIISNPDLPSVYEIPLVLHEQKMDRALMKALKLPIKQVKLREWKKLCTRIKKKKSRTITIAIVGKYFATGEYQLRDAYAALFDAIDHASWATDVKVQTKWVSAEKVEKNGAKAEIGTPDGIIVPIGWGERGAEGMIQAATYARENKIPYLGLCYGMQLAAVSFARSVIGWKDANTEENDKKTIHDVIHLMPSQKTHMELRAYGGTMRLGEWEAIVKPGTIAWESYAKYGRGINTLDKKTGMTSERHRHRFEFNDDFVKEFEKAGLIISARSKVEKLAEIIELPRDVHPFFVGTQGHPEYKSRPLSPHPIFVSYLLACKAEAEHKLPH